MGYILGIDTSCYTTSIALIDESNKLIYQDKKLLKVDKGERGLQQSAGVFQHLLNLPVMIDNLFKKISPHEIACIGVSARPRPIENSYMPVFKVGEGFGQALSSSLEIPLFRLSHQEGHIMAGLWSAGGPSTDNFLAVHISGGTSELLSIKNCNNKNDYNNNDNNNNNDNDNLFMIELLGGTIDIHAGQFIDRIGVALGLSFPAGPHIEEIAESCDKELRIPTSVEEFNFSFSGPESAALRMITQGEGNSNIARAIEHCIATTLEKVLRKAVNELNIRNILIVGGVASNKYIRNRLIYRLEHKAVGAKLFFAEPQFSTDNAVGIALITNIIHLLK